jgi:hypothetical protein
MMSEPAILLVDDNPDDVLLTALAATRSRRAPPTLQLWATTDQGTPLGLRP